MFLYLSFKNRTSVYEWRPRIKI